MDFTEKTISEEIIFKGKILTLKVNDVKLPNGKNAKREIVTHVEACAILAVEDEKVILVKQYRKPVEKVLTEIPAGKLEEGEDALEGAKRELKEETGYEAESWEKIMTILTSPGFSNEIIHIFLARNLSFSGQNLDEDEFVEISQVDIKEAKAMIDKGIIDDAKTISAILWYYARNK